MKTENIDVLQKNKVENKSNRPVVNLGCCGGPPTGNEDACCKLDEEKKNEGESGCGCNTGTTTKSSCC
jgi:hypothetical protein